MRSYACILVTGGCGFIGINFIRYLLSNESGFTGIIVNIDKLGYASQPHALDDMPSSRYYFIHGDITNATLIQKVMQEFPIDAVCHLAAESHVDRSIKSPDSFMQSNIIGTFNLLEAIRCHNPNIYLHHVSTDEVFGALKEMEAAFTEDSPYHPNNPYSASKASSDHLVWAYQHTYNLKVTMSHTSNNYGPYQHTEKFIPHMIHNILELTPLPLYGDGMHIRDWIHVTDHVQAIWLIMCHGALGESYNIGASNPWRNIEVVKLLCDIIAPYKNVASPESLYQLITPVPDRLGHDYRYEINASKIKKELDWQAKISFKKGLEEYIYNLLQ